MLTAAEIAAFLGVTPSAIRQVVRRNRIQRVGTRGRSHTAVYDINDVLRHTGTRDRLVLIGNTCHTDG